MPGLVTGLVAAGIAGTAGRVPVVAAIHVENIRMMARAKFNQVFLDVQCLMKSEVLAKQATLVCPVRTDDNWTRNTTTSNQL